MLSDRDPAPEVSRHYRGGAGTPLVLLHPGGSSWRAWRPVLPALAARHEVFAPTLAGHRGGPELGPGERVSFRTITDHVERDLDDAGLEDVHVAGNSLGGAVALELARRGRARSVVGFSPAGHIPSPWMAKRVLGAIEVGRRALLAPGAVRLLKVRACRRGLMLPILLHGERIPVDDLVLDARSCRIAPALLRGVLAEGPFAALDPGSVPVRLAWSRRDRVIPWRTFGAPLAAKVSGAEVIKLPGVGHVPMYDDPALVVRTILEVTTVVDGGSSDRDRLRRVE
ncbi:alpha/beta fold hydrolase [Nocardioides limicola]|uniref:alpha/beta fold hydrolase n=1 Tax=Nocardioides limicola TaxID=2803368 RepID=UPI00193C39E2|nr:alpha/beta fold hydrolase [Nocardioides sp. DJM-14]